MPAVLHLGVGWEGHLLTSFKNLIPPWNFAKSNIIVMKSTSSSSTVIAETSNRWMDWHYGTETHAETLQGEETVKEAMISSDISMEWKTYRRYLAK